MLKIRSDQNLLLRTEVVLRLAPEFAAGLREEIPSAVAALTDEELERRVRFGIRKILRHGAESRASLRKFLLYMFIVAPDFDEHPWINAMIHDPDHSVDHNIQALASVCNEDHWNEAAERSNGSWQENE